MLKTRNFSFDTDKFSKIMPRDENFLGTKEFLREIKKKVPKNYNRELQPLHFVVQDDFLSLFNCSEAIPPAENVPAVKMN